VGRSGRLWARRFYDHVVRNEDDFEECVRYIHGNPLVSGIVASPGEYPYSSVGYSENGASDWGEFDPPWP
jgi:putative transposase